MKATFFDGLLQSLDEARRHARGESVPGLQVHVRQIARNEIAAVRIKSGLTQGAFARAPSPWIGQ